MADNIMEAMLFNDDDSDSDDSNANQQEGAVAAAAAAVAADPVKVQQQSGGNVFPPPAVAALSMSSSNVTSDTSKFQSVVSSQPSTTSVSPIRMPGPAPTSPIRVSGSRSPLVRMSTAPSSSNIAPPSLPSSLGQSYSNVTNSASGATTNSSTETSGSYHPLSRNVPRGASTSATSGMQQAKVSTMSQQDQQAKLKSLYQQSASSALHGSSASSINRPSMPATSGPISVVQPSRSMAMSIEPTPLRDMQSQSQSQRHLQSTASMSGQALQQQQQQQQQQPAHAMMGMGQMKNNQTSLSGASMSGQVNRNVGSSGNGSGGRILAPPPSSHSVPQHSMHPSNMPPSSSSVNAPAAPQPMPAMPSSGTGIFPPHGTHPSSYSRNNGPPPSSLSAAPSSSVTASATLSAEQKTSKERKEQFLMFTKVLMKYLEQKDPAMHTRAKEVIRDCARKNKEGNPSYSSLSASMQSHLKNLVGDIYWKKAQEYLRQYLATQYLKSGKPPQEARRKAELMARSAASPLAIESGVVGGMVGMPAAAAPTPMAKPMPMEMSTKGPGVSMPLPPGRGQGMSGQGTGAATAARKPKSMPQQSQRKGGANVPPSGLTTMKAGMKPTIFLASASEKLKQQSDGAKLVPENVAIDSQTVPAPSSGSGGSKKKNATAASGSGSGKVSSGSAKSGTSGSSVGKNASSSPTATSKKKKVVPSIPKKTVTTTVTSSPGVPREYNEALEMLDHVVDYDVRSCALILGKESKKRGDVNISEEQRKLLYHDFGITKIGPRKGLFGGIIPTESLSPKSVIDESIQSTLPLYLKGWGTRNIVSSRIAWAKLRLLEEEEEKLGGISLPTIENGEDTTKISPSKDSTSPKKATTASASHDWFNDESAEEDEALALISEATQRYIRTLLEGAMNCASRRLNLDGIRLWHQQHAAANLKESDKTSSSTTQDKNQDPPLHLRLGCDTRRQYALVQGNAAKTYQRFEEALSRHPINKDVNAETMYNATSMTDLSKIPKLPSAVTKADYHAKRAFEIYGGKESGEPPLGRVPKKAKILAKDFQLCLEDSDFVVKRKRASTLAFY